MATVELAEQPAPRASVVAVSLALLTLLAWGAALLAPGAKYWDDWAVANTDTLRFARELGLPWIGYVLVALFALGPWAFKVLAIVSTFVVGLATYGISGRGLGLTARERWLLAALVVALPLYSTRVLAILSTYSWSLALFFCAWYLLVRRSPQTPGRGRYVLAAVLFFVSYTTASLLPFTALPVAHLAYLAVRRDVSLWRGILGFIGRYWYLCAAPIVFWVVRSLFLQPYGLYATYNQIGSADGQLSLTTLSAVGMIVAIVLICLVFLYWLRATWPRDPAIRGALSLAVLTVATLVFGLYLNATRVSSNPLARAVPLVLLACALVVAAVVIVQMVRIRRGRTLLVSRDRELTPILAVGLAALGLAMLPYLLVGKLPSFVGFETRHQLLMPFGVAIIIVATVRGAGTIMSATVTKVLAVALVAAMTALSAVVSLSLVADAHKQEQVIRALAAEPLVRDASTVVFADNASALGFEGRGYDFYEFNGWMKTAFGDEKRLGLSTAGVADFLDGNYEPLYYAASRYGFGDYVPTTEGVLVTIDPLDGANWWTMLLDQPGIELRVSPVADIATLAAP